MTARKTPKPSKRKASGTAAPEKGKAGAQPVARRALDAIGIDKVCEWISEGVSLTAIATKAKVSKGALLEWLAADRDRSARAREARATSARHWDEKAEQELRDAGDAFGLAKAREIASHYRWRASKIAPEYGERVDHNHTGRVTLEQLVTGGGE